MAFNIVLTSGFRKELKRIAKKHRSILKDVSVLVEQLSNDPTMGKELGQNVYKIRLALSGTQKGKSGGARVITFVKVVGETVILSEIYLKSEFDTVDINLVIDRLLDEGFI